MPSTKVYATAVLSVAILCKIFSPDLLLKQLQMMGSYDPFWKTNLCLGGGCAAVTATCFSSYRCIETVGCINKCILENMYSKEKVAACAYLCEMTYGYENLEFTDLIGCMLEQQCLQQYPQDGPCIGSDEDAVQSVATMEDIAGDWWVLRGVNCGEDPYPGGYDWYPCQHERFIRAEDGSWTNKVTYCGGKMDECRTDIITTVANVSMTRPGVVHHVYTDAPLDPQVEDWRLVSLPHPDYALMLWCGRLPVLDYSGGIVISRHRSDENMPEEVQKEFRRVLKKFGLDWDKMCPSNNNHCPA